MTPQMSKVPGAMAGRSGVSSLKSANTVTRKNRIVNFNRVLRGSVEMDTKAFRNVSITQSGKQPGEIVPKRFAAYKTQQRMWERNVATKESALYCIVGNKCGIPWGQRQGDTAKMPATVG